MIGIKGIAKKPITDATAVADDVKRGKIFYNNSGKKIGTYQPSVSSLEQIVRFTVPAGEYPNRYGAKDVKIDGISRNIYESYSILTTGDGKDGSPSVNYSGQIYYYDTSKMLEFKFPTGVNYCSEIKIPHNSVYQYTTIPLELYINVYINIYSRDLFKILGYNNNNSVNIIIDQNSKKILIVSDTSDYGSTKILEDTYIECKFV